MDEDALSQEMASAALETLERPPPLRLPAIRRSTHVSPSFLLCSCCPHAPSLPCFSLTSFFLLHRATYQARDQISRQGAGAV